MMKKLLCLLTLGLALVSCKEECLDCKFETVVPTSASRVFVLYLAMDNSLNPYADHNINELLRAANKQSLNDGVIYVFRDVPNQDSKLISIFYDDAADKTQQLTVKDYGENLDSGDPATLRRVLADVELLIDTDSWALGFGSHGLNWFPDDNVLYNKYVSRSRFRTYGAGDIQTRILMQDDESGSIMEYEDFADALPDHVDFILMDLCLMGGIEFAYALRDKADYLVLSPAEVIAKGMPYENIVDDIFADDLPDGLRGICDEFYEYYDNYSDIRAQFGTISLFDCSAFDGFTDVMRQLLSGVVVTSASVDLDELLRYDRFRLPITFDLREYVEALGLRGPEFDAALEALVPYKLTTGKPLSGEVPIPEARFSGVTTYVPTDIYGDLNEKYFETGWYKAVYE